MADDGEVWKNSSAGSVWITRIDDRGQKQYEKVKGGASLKITSDDRELQSQMAASEDQDIFKNGRLTPVKLLEGSEIEQEIASNPNMKSEPELVALFDAHWKTFAKDVAAISNLTTLERLREMAGGDEVSATVKQVEQIEARITELNPVQVSERTRVGPEHIAGSFEGTSA